MRKTLLSVALLGVFGCGSSASTPSSGGEDTSAGSGSKGGGGAASPPSGTGSGDTAGAGSGSGAAGGGTATGGSTAGLSPSGNGVANGVGPGVLTAGIWDDSLNYDFFSQYLARPGPIAGDPGFAKSDYDASHAEFAQRAPHATVDAAIVLDTTGSMTDEIAYLTAEFANISGEVLAKFPNASQRWALVVYRDTPDTDPGDEYIVRSFDFTASAGDFAVLVSQQTAAGGGDYPESPELGLERLTQLTWRADPSVAKLAFWVGDAPQHDYRGAAMKQAIADVHAAGIHLYPVSASGTNDLLELTMRSAAEITGGRYLFLTDDSGVGDSHKEPEIPCYFVTRLSKALVRSVSMELSGIYSGPDPADVLRTSGSPSSDGKCTTQSGQTVEIF